MRIERKNQILAGQFGPSNSSWKNRYRTRWKGENLDKKKRGGIPIHVIKQGSWAGIRERGVMASSRKGNLLQDCQSSCLREKGGSIFSWKGIVPFPWGDDQRREPIARLDVPGRGPISRGNHGTAKHQKIGEKKDKDFWEETPFFQKRRD